jgi:hypothetical protein
LSAPGIGAGEADLWIWQTRANWNQPKFLGWLEADRLLLIGWDLCLDQAPDVLTLPMMRVRSAPVAIPHGGRRLR